MRVRGGIRSVVEGVDFINLYLPHQKLKESLCPIFPICLSVYPSNPYICPAKTCIHRIQSLSLQFLLFFQLSLKLLSI